MSKSKRVTIGYKYYFDIHMGLGRGPYDGIIHVKVGGKTAWKGFASGNTSIHIKKKKLFGGDLKEGGIYGHLHILMGAPDQPVHSELAAMLGGLVPAFRGVVTMYYSGLVTAMTPYPKPWAFRHCRALEGWDGTVWYPEKARILLTDPETGETIYAMNPAHIMYELETNRDFGLGRPRSMMDDAAWRAAADTLFDEGFGLCLRWVRSDSVLSFAANVMAHLGGNLYSSRSTGLRKLTLIREDYDPDTLPHFTPDTGLLDIEEDDNSTAAQAPNEIIVTWKNPIDNSERKARERNAAGIRAAGGRIISEDANYIGCPTYALAARLARRDLRAKSIIKRWTLKLDRRARSLEPGAPFKFSDPARGLNSVIVRAGRIIDNGSIDVTAVLDVYGMPTVTFTEPVPSGWIPPNLEPEPIADRRVLESTWRDLVFQLDQANLNLVGTSSGFIRTLAVKPTALSLSYDIETQIGAGAWVARDTGDFCPSAILTTAVSRTETVFSIGNGVDLELITLGMAALIDNEWLRVDVVDLEAMTVTFGRACIDSVPTTHSVGARIWFVDGYGGNDPTEYTATTSVNTRLLVNTSSGQLEPDDAPSDSLTIAARQAKPFPPANFKINGSDWPATVTGDIVAIWAHRDRLLQADLLVDTTEGNVGPEPGTTYVATLRNNSTSAVIVSHTGISGATDTILESALTGLGGVEMRLEVYSVRGGIESIYKQVAVFTWNPSTP